MSIFHEIPKIWLIWKMVLIERKQIYQFKFRNDLIFIDILITSLKIINAKGFQMDYYYNITTTVIRVESVV